MSIELGICPHGCIFRHRGRSQVDDDGLAINAQRMLDGGISDCTSTWAVAREGACCWQLMPLTNQLPVRIFQLDSIREISTQAGSAAVPIVFLCVGIWSKNGGTPMVAIVCDPKPHQEGKIREGRVVDLLYQDSTSGDESEAENGDANKTGYSIEAASSKDLQSSRSKLSEIPSPNARDAERHNSLG
jgi:hypothetical protein